MAPAPFFDDIAYGPLGGAANWLTTADGLRIRVAHWTGSNIKGTVLIFPGRTEYVEKYGDTAGALKERGYASIAIDWRGQGLADRMMKERRIGHVKKFSDYQHDVAVTVGHAEALGLPRPYYLLAHSMGGCIGLRALHNGLDVQAAAFSAPMWGLAMATWLKPFAWGLPAVARQLGRDEMLAPGQTLETYVLREDFELNTLTRDREMWTRLQEQAKAQPVLSLGGPSLGWLYEASREMQGLSEMPSPAYPCLTFLGTAEKIVDPDRIEERMAQWPDGHLEMLQGGEHEVMVEIPETRAHVFDMIAAHFDAHP